MVTGTFMVRVDLSGGSAVYEMYAYTAPPASTAMQMAPNTVLMIDVRFLTIGSAANYLELLPHLSPDFPTEHARDLGVFTKLEDSILEKSIDRLARIADVVLLEELLN